MATLIEEIELVKNAKTSKTAKKAALIQLGLTPTDVYALLQRWAPETAATRTPRTSFTFGVEIECFVAYGAIRSAAAQTGMRYRYERYNHRDGQAHFKFVPDCSVTGMANPIECVSPVLQGTDGKNTLKNACETLNQANANVNITCGLHVHIGAESLTTAQYANVFVNYAYLESVIDSFMAESRRNNRFAKSLRQIPGLVNATTRGEILSLTHNTRYYKVNPVSFEAHKTIEFRQHQGTTNFTKIYNWVRFCAKLVEWSKNNRLTAPVTSIDDIKFLTETEKRFFKQRQSEFANN